MNQDQPSGRRLLAAILSAVLVGASAFPAYFIVTGVMEGVVEQAWFMAVASFIVGAILAAGHVALLGLPLYGLLSRRWRLRWWSAAIGGFLVGGLPYLVLLNSPGEYSQIGGTVLSEHGRYTAAGWRQLFEVCAWLGLIGALAGLAFWAALNWRREAPE